MMAKSKNKNETAITFPGGNWLVNVTRRDTSGTCLLGCPQASDLIFWLEMTVTPWQPQATARISFASWSPDSREMQE